MNEPPATLVRAARRLRLVTLFGTALVLIGFLFGAWVTLAGRGAEFPALGVGAGGLPPVPAAIVLALFGLLVALALLRLAAMLREVEGGIAFPAAALRGFARYLFLAVLASILGPPLLGLAWGMERVSLSLDSGQALMLLITGLLFFVARLLGEARRLADDHSQIV